MPIKKQDHDEQTQNYWHDQSIFVGKKPKN